MDENTQTLLAELTKVNDKYNAANYVTDKKNYGIPDYYALPMELLENGGDCEDYAFAKYLELEKDIEADRMKLSYVKTAKNEAHMVLQVDDFVLDNMTSDIKPLKERGDLEFVYQFNRNDLFLKGNKIGKAEQNEKWKELLSFTEENKDEEEDFILGDDYVDGGVDD